MKSKAEAGFKLLDLVQTVGIPSDLVSDNAKEETSGKFKEVVDECRIKHTLIEPYSHWQNRAETGIKNVKRGIERTLQRTQAPKSLWNYCGEWVSDIRSLTAHPTASLDGRVPAEKMTGNTPDISEYLHYDWYEYVWYHNPVEGFPENRRQLGRWLGVAHKVGQPMCYWILTKKGTVLSRTTVQPMTLDERRRPEEQMLMADLDAEIKAKLGDSVNSADVDDGDPDEIFGEALDEGLLDERFQRKEADDFTPDSLDEYLTMKLLMPRGDEMLRAKVTGRKRNLNGDPVGIANSNPILDTREYEVEFPDGSTEIYMANTIAENMYAQVDDEGHEFLFMQEIADHKKDGSAVSRDDMFVRSANGQQRMRLTTKGWKLMVRWKDGTSSWEPLRNLKESNPVEVAEYAVANKISEEPAFAWWVKSVLRKRDRILAKVKSRYWSRTHKFGIQMPKTVAEALGIDKETGTDFWKKAIEKEMKNVIVAFEFKEDDVVPIGYKHIDCHWVFDVKIGDLTRKARLVADGQQTEVPRESTYSSVVSRDSVRIAFLLAALNDLEVVAADIQGAYLYADTTEKVYTIAGSEFGSNAGRPAIIVRALYGLRSSGARFRSHLAASLRDMHFTMSKADPDVWMRKAVKPDGTLIYEYVLCYVDDLLAAVLEPDKFIAALRSTYKLKETSVGEPKEYLGAEVSKHYLPDSEEPAKVRWAMSSDKYVKRALGDVQIELDRIGKVLPTRVSTPMVPGYRPEIDGTPELASRQASYYQGLIGILRWTVELGRIDILIDVAMLSSHAAAPREGHLDQAFHVFAYLKHHGRSKLVFDDTNPEFDERRFKKCNWSETYPDAEEAIPTNMPEPRGKPVTVNCFVDASHAGCQVTRRSQTGVIIFCNRAPIIWYSKRQNTVESSTFGSEFVSMRTALELIEGLRYKLRMFGVPLDGPANVFCDNEAVVRNTTAPESTLKKKHVAICYHRCREAVAAVTMRIAKEDTGTNLADIATKCLPGPKLREMSGCIMW
jgi:hypothetical protein